MVLPYACNCENQLSVKSKMEDGPQFFNVQLALTQPRLVRFRQIIHTWQEIVVAES